MIMNRSVIFAKIKSSSAGAREIIERMEESYKEGVKKYYNFPKDSDDIIGDIKETDNIYFAAFLWNYKNSEQSIEKIYLGEGTLNENRKGTSIQYIMKVESPLNIALRNICKLAELNLSTDFEDTYIFCVNSELVVRQIEVIVHPPKQIGRIEREYEHKDTEDHLHYLAQRNEYCRRQYNLQEPTDYRSEYQRDYERVVHSKAFRRMVDKAQVFSAVKGDYYRTRMTHSQIVAQIGRAIAGGLGLNLCLTEAIALGHDIGHTPYGHQGERTLDDILRGNGYDIIVNRDLLYPEAEEGFKHNYQSVRVATVLEESYPQIRGLDLSFQTLEGMLKHTKLRRDSFSLKSFVDCVETDLHFDEDFCSTLEGQVVAIADEIAQRGHDLDDALSSGAIAYDELERYFELRKMKQLADILQNTSDEMDTAKREGIWQIDEDELKRTRIVSAILAYFVEDVINHSLSEMEKYSEEEFEANGHIVTRAIITFSSEAKVLNSYLETIISNRVINNPEVSLFDSNAATIVSGLFKAYYNNPRLLHSGTKHRMFLDMRKVSANVVDFEFGNHEIIREELSLITKQDLNDLKSVEESREYKEKRKILVRSICDYISGMTDTYATNEYNKIAKTV